MPDDRDGVPCEDPDCDRTFANAGAAALHHRRVHTDQPEWWEYVGQAEAEDLPEGDDSWREVYADGGCDDV